MIGTMKFYRHLYVSDSIRNLEKVKWKLRHNAGQITIYIIALANLTTSWIFFTVLFCNRDFMTKRIFLCRSCLPVMEKRLIW